MLLTILTALIFHCTKNNNNYFGTGIRYLFLLSKWEILNFFKSFKELSSKEKEISKPGKQTPYRTGSSSGQAKKDEQL